jgi:putative nucleotidyltransferase with HDIG domain
MMNYAKLRDYFGSRKNNLVYGFISQVVVFIFFFLLVKGFITPPSEGTQLKEILAASIPFVSLGILLRIAFDKSDIPILFPLIVITPLLISGPSLFIICLALICVPSGYVIAGTIDYRTQLTWMAMVGAFSQIIINSTLWYMVNGEENVGKIFFSSLFLIVTGPGLLGILIYIGEEIFDVSTELKIMDICNETNPLLRRLRSRAPGTFYHSANTAFIAEEGAAAIGADRFLCRAGGLYHDIGKLWKPDYYSENQFGEENVHEQVSKDVSRLIIVSHIDEGIKLAEKHGLGKSIEEIIRRHHGNAPLYYYDPRIRREADRYPGPLPISKEEGIVMLSDGVEATGRSLTEMSEAELGKVVRFVMSRGVKDGQIADAGFSKRDLHMLEEAFIRSLKIIYHNRIFYPSQDGLAFGGADDAGLFEKLSPEPEGKDEVAEKDGERGPGGFEYH